MFEKPDIWDATEEGQLLWEQIQVHSGFLQSARQLLSQGN
jgi:hypothetical protein